MNPNSLRATAAAPLASLALLLAVCVVLLQSPHSVGIRVPLAQLHKTLPQPQCNSLEVSLWLTNDGRTWINWTELRPEDIRGKIAEVMEYRSVKNVYVIVELQVSYQQFVNFMSRIVDASPNLHVVLLTSELRREIRKGEVDPVCTVLDSPESEALRPFARYLNK
jgi:biopolymer transport protein ExbD